MTLKSERGHWHTGVVAGLIVLAWCGACAPPSACPSAQRTVEMIVNPELGSAIDPGLERFAQDLCADGYEVTETRRSFESPVELREHLRARHSALGSRLDGVILVGEAPRAYQYVTVESANPSIPPSSEEVISYQFYADLDGSFTASPGYHSPEGRTYSYDQHEGDVDWELWVGVLPIYRSSVSDTEAALVRFFDKNHAYRTGVDPLPRAFIEVSEHFTATTSEEHERILADMSSGTYSWQPFSEESSARLYFNSPPGGLSVDQGYAALSSGAADFFVGDAHGWAGAHGKLTIDQVESNPVKTVFFWSNGCAVGNLDRGENFLSSVLYSPTSRVLVAKGTTNNSGGMGNNQDGYFGHNVATALSRGESLGAAIRSHVNVPLINPWNEAREFHMATSVVLGDPTLKLRR
ncbi:hypothetical protein KYC5002_10640 [Archangium violaceum]|uniref:hypothetical protein n=1 Tax=Archangium violaceum TaxID=83451 RepID=UPI002B31D3A7|nr:hypothetical protein KYC5002_10640 [Archangium gephyra]